MLDQRAHALIGGIRLSVSETAGTPRQELDGHYECQRRSRKS